MTDPYPVRPIGEDEFDAFALVDEHAFHGAPMTADERAMSIARVEWDRTLAAFDPSLDAPVGVTAIFSFQLTVPGASVPAAGVSWVGVLPTHRRRGVLNSLMRRQLSDIASRGEPLAVLWASEAPIYGRYGYGRASWVLTYDVRRGEGLLSGGSPDAASRPPDAASRPPEVAGRPPEVAGRPPEAAGRPPEAAGRPPEAAGRPPEAAGRPPEVAGRLLCRLVAPAAARQEMAKVYDLVLQSRPGFFARSAAWWDRRLSDPENRRNGAGPLRCLLAEDAQGARGYALYAGVPSSEDGAFLPDSTLTVRELVAADAAASAALWSDLLSRDLTSSFHASLRPVDDPLLYQLADPRRVRPALSDGLWVRLVDLPAALSARRYACPVDVVVEVRDRYFPGNAGRWRLRTAGPHPAASASASAASASAAGGGFMASCERSADAADLELDIAELGAAYLGGTKLSAPADAGLVTEHRPGAVRHLSAAMSWDPAPWCPMIF